MRRGACGLVVLVATWLAFAVPATAQSPGIAPPGANDPACESRSTPVILLHGTSSDMTINWPYIAPRLMADGYCFWALDLPERGRAPIAAQAEVLRRFVAHVRRATGSRRVSFVGHSLGGLVARYYVRFEGGGDRVRDSISLGTPHKGYVSTEESKPIDDLYNTDCPSCLETAAGSDLLMRLNRGDMSPGSASYTQIGTIHDEFAGRWQNVFLRADKRVSNILLQDRCPDHYVGHLGLAGDDLTYRWIRHALRTRGPADPDKPISCPPP